MPGGRFIAVLFFLSVIFAGITSLINMFEVRRGSDDTPEAAAQSRRCIGGRVGLCGGGRVY